MVTLTNQIKCLFKIATLMGLVLVYLSREKILEESMQDAGWRLILEFLWSGKFTIMVT